MAPRKRKRVVRVSVTRAELRNRTAQARGYRNYYDFRTHDNGRIPPGEPVKPERLRKARGHAGPEDLVRELRPGDFIMLTIPVGSIEVGTRTIRERRPSFRTPSGFQSFERVATPARTEDVYVEIGKRVIRFNGGERDYLIRNITRDALIELIAREVEAGATFSPAPSLDQRRIPSRRESPDGY